MQEQIPDAGATAAPVADAVATVPSSALSQEISNQFAISAAQTQINYEQLVDADDALALTKMGFSHLIHSTDAIGMTVLLVMGVMSAVTWFYVFYNLFRLLVVRRRGPAVVQEFWEARSPAAATDLLRAQPYYEPFSKIAIDAVEAAAHHADAQGSRTTEVMTRHEFIERSLGGALKREQVAFDSGLTFLATVGSTAPFVGLFGTVWGIYHALIGISLAKKATLSVVAAPVGEALIMTCIGLGVAIPAVLAYNYFVRSNKVLNSEFANFANDLLDFFATGERVRRSQRYGTRQPADEAATT